ncbi:MAG: GntR family transcriptional regulator [Chloroflexi bacterium]|nr:GntR family transcriptional regulator [Chloroflexota bacterium]
MDDSARILIPTQKHSLADNATMQIRQAILEGELAPGEHLREEVLAEMLSVSRGPVREALTRLEQEALVVREPNRGVFVCQLNRNDVDEVYSLRLALEKLAVRLAIETPCEAELKAMQQTVDQMRMKAAVGISSHEAAKLNTAYHEQLCAASGHRRLLASWTNLRSQIYLFLLTRSELNSEFLKTFHVMHQEILDAIVEKDETKATALLEKHFLTAYNEVTDHYSRSAAAKKSAALTESN